MPTPMENAAKLAKLHGLKWFLGDWPSYKPGYGQGADNCADLCHEVAHFLVSPKRLRDRPHFGLGHPESSGPGLTVLGQATLDQGNKLEEQASILGIVLQVECGESLSEAKATAKEHDWCEYDSDPILRLEKKKLWSPERDMVWRSVVQKAGR